MSRLPSSKTAKIWAERIAQCERSNTPVAQFCQSINCSPTSFYQWKRKLAAKASSNRLSAFANIGAYQGLDRDQTPLGNLYPGSSLGRGIHLCDPRTGSLKEMLTTNPSVPIYLHSEPIDIASRTCLHRLDGHRAARHSTT
jgi:hypothetical protein